MGLPPVLMSVGFGTALCVASTASAAEQKVTLPLGGKFCDAYKGEVAAALKKVAGVTAVDLKSVRDHAVVTGDSGTMKRTQLVSAVNALKGEGWHCKAEVVR